MEHMFSSVSSAAVSRVQRSPWTATVDPQQLQPRLMMTTTTLICSAQTRRLMQRQRNWRRSA